MEIVRLVWFDPFHISITLYFVRLFAIIYFEILNILPLNPKKSSDFYSIFVDFTWYIVKSADFS